MNQLLVAGIGAAVVAGGGFVAGWRVNSWRHDSQQLAIEQAAAKAAQAVSGNAVSAIEGLGVRYVPIKQKAEVITSEHVVYRECSHTADGLQVVNAALSGAESRPDPAGMPAANPAR